MKRLIIDTDPGVHANVDLDYTTANAEIIVELDQQRFIELMENGLR